MTEASQKETPKFVIYESCNKYFVKYPDSPEREITLMEYKSLQKEKDRIFETMLLEPVNYAQAERLPIESTYSSEFSVLEIKFYKHPIVAHAQSFECGSCYGEYYKLEDSFVMESVFNSSKGNGDFKKTLELFFMYCRENSLVFTMTNLPQSLIDSLKNAPYNKPVQVTKNTIIFL